MREKFTQRWNIFLNARRDVIMWMKEMHFTDERIAHLLSMDAIQVYQIRMAILKNGGNFDEPKKNPMS